MSSETRRFSPRIWKESAQSLQLISAVVVVFITIFNRMSCFQRSLIYSRSCDGDVLSHDDVFLQLKLNKSQFSVRWCLQIKKNYNFKPFKMIWRRKRLIPATFLIIMMKVFTGHTTPTCHPAEYLIGNKCCPMCAAGHRVETDCSEFRTSCLPCLDGTYMDKPTGGKDCFRCTSCDGGLGLKVKTSCTTISKAVCEPLEGFYCIDPVGNNCVEAQKHRICHPGQYIKQKGTAFTDTVCSDCSNGTFSDGTITSCHPHTQCELINLQLIKPGNASTDAECGENSSYVTVAVTITSVLILSLISAGVVYLFCFKKKKSSLQQAGRNRISIIFNRCKKENEDEEQSLESISRLPEERNRSSSVFTVENEVEEQSSESLTRIARPRG